MPKLATFFCEYCGTKVYRNAKVCKKCGHFFSSVKCPHCEFCGKVEYFVSGCPNCGYATRATLGNAATLEPGSKKKKNHYYVSPPWWAFVAMVVVILALLVLLIQAIR